MDTTKEAYEKILNSLFSIKENLSRAVPDFDTSPHANNPEFNPLLSTLKSEMLGRVKGFAKNLLLMMEVENRKHPDYHTFMNEIYKFVHSIEGDWV
jgi:hypothetical protein